MATYNVTMKRYVGSTWDTIYPKTIASNIISGEFDAARIPTLDAAKIGTGTLADARIPNLNASKVNAGAFDVARIPSLPGSIIGSGTIDAARLPSMALTNVWVATVMATFISGTYALDPNGVQEGDVVICTTDNLTYIHNGGVAGTIADFTVLQTPTDLVSSVAGKTGVVTLVKADVGLGSVDNTADTAKPVSTAQQTALNLKANKVTITGATKPKITYNAEGIVTAGADLAATDIPSLDTAKITTGTFADARIPALAISKITGLQTNLDTRQLTFILTTEALLSGISAAENMIALVQA